MRRRNHTRKGFNLIEAAIVLGVVGFVIGGIWTAAASVRENQKIEQAMLGVLTIVKNTRRVFSGNWPSVYTRLGTSSGSTPPLAVKMGLMIGVDGFYIRNSYIHDPWGKEATEGVQIDINHPTCPSFVSVWFRNLDTSSCIKLVSAITSRFHDNTNLNNVILPAQSSLGCGVTSFPIIPTKAQCTGNWLGFSFSP